MRGIEIFHEQMHDGTLLYVRKFSGDDSRAVLVLPDVGESVEEGIYPHLWPFLKEYSSYFVELRGHEHSHGVHTLQDHWKDIQYWIIRLKKQHKELYVIARGLSASLLLRYEDQAHYLGMKARPPVPDGMVLLDPVFDGKKVKSSDKELHKFFLPPVRTQTPTRVFIRKKEYTTSHLKRFFGNCQTIQAKWLHTRPLTRVEYLLGLKQVATKLKEVVKEDTPIRFSQKW